MTPQIIRSARRTFAMELKGDALMVRVPLRASDRQIQQFIDQHERWLQKALTRQAQQQREALPLLTQKELEELAARAKEVIPRRVAHYAALLGVTYGRITIRRQRSRWGSCSAKGNLNFNCLLMLAPVEVLDSVVVHELCHRKHMDHSPQFYAEVFRVMPDYKVHHRWLKDHGEALIRRLPGDTHGSIASHDTGNSKSAPL